MSTTHRAFRKIFALSIFILVVGIILAPRAAYAAIAIDASTPVRWAGVPAAGAALTSASFTAPANSVLVLCVNADDLSTKISFSVTDSGGLSWTTRGIRDLFDVNGVDGHASMYTAVTTSATARTVSVTRDVDDNGDNRVSAKLYVVTGANTASPVSAVGEGSSVSNSITPTIYNAAAGGTYAFVCGTDWNGNGTPTSNDLTVDGATYASISVFTGYKVLNADGTQTANLDAAGAAAAAWDWVALAVTPRSGIAKPTNNLGLIGYWPMNEGTTTKSSDFSGNGNTGTFTGSSPPTSTSGWTNGKRGGALGFDGTNDCLDVGDMNSTEGQTKLTISVWLYDRSPGTGKGIVSKYTGVAGNWALFTSDVGAGGSDDMEFDPDGAEAVYTTTNAHKANRWEHWVVVYDGTQGTDLGKVDLYLNGVVQAETLTSTPIGSVTGSNTNTVCIGSDSDTTAGINAVIDEVRIYNRALSVSEVRALYGNNTSGAVRANASSKTLTNGTTLGPSGGLVGLWTFDGGDVNWTSATAGTVTDGSGSGNNGSLVSMIRATSVAIGKLGQALSFDGTSEISTADINTTDAVSKLSVAFWAKPTALSSDFFHYVSKNNDTNGWSVYSDGASGLSGTNKGINFTKDGVAGREGGTSAAGGVMSLNTWAHVIVVFDETLTQPNCLKIYVNGISQSITYIDDGTLMCGGTTTSNAAIVTIGGQPAGGTDPNLTGIMDDVRIYNRALSPAEVKQLYLLGSVKIKP